MGAADELIRRAESALAHGDDIRAAQYLEAAIGHGADTDRVRALLWRTYASAGRYSDLRRSVLDHLDIHPDDREARAILEAFETAPP